MQSIDCSEVHRMDCSPAPLTAERPSLAEGSSPFGGTCREKKESFDYSSIMNYIKPELTN